jgi:hypothetical protein
MVERRQSGRIAAKTPCVLSVNGRQVSAQLDNLSEHGALFTIKAGGSEAVSNGDLGFDASFVLSSVTPARKYIGEIIRLYFKDGAAHIGLRFWKKYTELPKP